jgi:hypothetical protein
MMAFVLLLAVAWTETNLGTSRAWLGTTTLLEATTELLGPPLLVTALQVATAVATAIAPRCASGGLILLLSTTAAGVDRGR